MEYVAGFIGLIVYIVSSAFEWLSSHNVAVVVFFLIWWCLRTESDIKSLQKRLSAAEYELSRYRHAQDENPYV